MKPDEMGLPTVIVPYPGPAKEPGYQDIFVNLRPETNGVIAESTILKVVKEANKTQDAMKLIYLANYPGEFILKHQIVEQYYSLRFHFAVHGKEACTESMKRRFSDWFQVDFTRAPLIGAFEAMERLGVQPEELFEIWVEEKDVVVINGQLIKKIGPYYVINYDIPALLHKNSKNTDVAIMMFRTTLSYEALKPIIGTMRTALCGIGVLNPQFDASRAFHYSKGPFEQILDSLSYLFTASDGVLDFKDFTFSAKLLEKGLKPLDIIAILRNPIVTYTRKDGRLIEDNFLLQTQYMDYESAWNSLATVVKRPSIITHGPILDQLEKKYRHLEKHP